MKAVAEAEGAAEGVNQLSTGVDAEQVVDRGGDVSRRDRVARGVGGPPVAGAEDRPPPDARPGEHGGETVRPVVAAVAARPGAADDRLADPRSPTELPGPDHQRRVEQSPRGQVVEQGAERL